MSDLFGNPGDRFSRDAAQIGFDVNCLVVDEPHHEKTGFLPMRKQRRRSASR